MPQNAGIAPWWTIEGSQAAWRRSQLRNVLDDWRGQLNVNTHTHVHVLSLWACDQRQSFRRFSWRRRVSWRMAISFTLQYRLAARYMHVEANRLRWRASVRRRVFNNWKSTSGRGRRRNARMCYTYTRRDHAHLKFHGLIFSAVSGARITTSTNFYSANRSSSCYLRGLSSQMAKNNHRACPSAM